ncbi:hydroxyacid oxidase 2 [Rousettus aegyptiacus]|uniref:hydroxyacid oxidase 2 n=1 Tax=Rousettus aegyptiacus TaxID=9407 RepID=UPI00168D4189|nr:hydroxyacid oxidase 2 [Rousettus aegyptiacus]
MAQRFPARGIWKFEDVSDCASARRFCGHLTSRAPGARHSPTQTVLVPGRQAGKQHPPAGSALRDQAEPELRQLSGLLHAAADPTHLHWDAEHGGLLVMNPNSFVLIRLRPWYLRDVSQVDTRTTVLGQEISAPICIAPTSFHCLAWPDGELSTARGHDKPIVLSGSCNVPDAAAQAAGICYVTSTYASRTLEDIAAAAPRGLRWLQLYVQTDRQLNEQLIQRAESLGFKALVITVDTPKIGKRRCDIRNQLDLEKMIMLMDLRSPKEGNAAPRPRVSVVDASFCWNDLAWLRSITRLPIILKGILTKEDAELALRHRVDGIIVSNHGGRQLDGVPASVDALPEVVAAVNGSVEVYVDGGIRTGTDVLKALALGAQCVFLGRPILWGLACKRTLIPGVAPLSRITPPSPPHL